MKTIIRSLITILAFAATSAFAAEPVAVWNGEDLNGTTQGGVTLNLNGNAYADGAITISGSNGVLLNNADANVCSVIIEYENFNTAANATQTLFTLQKSGGEDNNIGVYWNTNAKLHGIYKNSSWDNGGPGDYTANAIPTSGRLGFGYNNSGNGVTVYAGDVTVYDADGLKEGGSTYTGVSIGGYRGTTAIGAASNMKITAIAFFTSKLSASDAAAYEFPEPPQSTPEVVALFNFRDDEGSDVEGWVNKLQNGGATVSVDCAMSGSTVNFSVAGNGGHFWANNTNRSSTDFEAGEYEDVNGTKHTSIAEEVSASLGLGSIAFNSEVYKSGIMNGAASGQMVTISGLDATESYVVYAGFGLKKSDSNGQHGFKITKDTGYSSVESLEYVTSVSGGNTTKATKYTTFTSGTSLTPGAQGVMIVRLNKIVPTSAGKIIFQFVQNDTNYDRGGINFLAIAKLPAQQSTAITAEIKADKKWSELGWESAPTVNDKVELTVSANAKLTIDNDTAFKSLKLIGTRNLTIAGITSENVALLSKISIGSFTGKLTFEIDASAGLTADQTLLTFIRTASEKLTFVFKGSGNKGAALGYGFTVNAAIHSHIVFDGGTHTMSYGYGGSGVDGNCFGVNANNSNPTVLVTGKATLNFTAKDLSFWNGVADMSGVIRVNDGATLNFLANGSNTIYYRQRLCLEPGASVTFPNVLTDSKPVMRFLGGTAENKEVIYVLPPTGNATTATISGNIFFAKDDTHGFGVFVDANSRLKWTGDMLVVDNNDDKAIVKRGAGVLEYSGTMYGVVQVAAGALGGNGSFRKLTLGANGTLDLNNGAPTVTGTFTCSPAKQLKLVIDKPTHMMPVITLPAAADKTGWKAYVSGYEKENELVVEGNTLKLKWREPPTIDVDIDDITIESTGDWNGGTVKIDVSGLDERDYEGGITYRLKFGEKTVDGLVEDNVAIFALDEYFTAGKIYRGIFELGYGDAGDTIEAAEVIIYEGKPTYADKEGLWVNETPDTLRKTGAYNPDNGVSIEDGVIKIDTQDEVKFLPTLDPDYVDKCDSEFTMTIFASEAVDDDLIVDEGAQAGVMIISDGGNGVAFYFINGGKEEWVKGPAADLNVNYDVTISFHYAKDDSDSDSVTYRIKDIVEDDTYKYAHRPGTADKVTEIVFADGTRFKSLIGTCQIEVADPVAQGIKPGEEQEIVADNDDEAQEKAAKIPVMIPEDDSVRAALDTDEKKTKYKALFKVVAVKKNGSYTAEVVFADSAIQTIKKDEKDILTEVVEALGSLLGEEGTLDNITGQPGLYYGIAADGSLVNMGEAQPDDWKIAGADGKITGLKVKKTANAKQGFYKVLCTPIKPVK